MSKPKNIVTSAMASDPRMAQLVRNLTIMTQRVKAVGDRYGLDPCRAMFIVKTDEQLMDDLVYPLGIPLSRNAWWYGKAVYQQRRSGHGGHVFEFATISNPAHVVLGESNDLMMHTLVIIHAWMGHVYLFTRNLWHDETDRETSLQKFAQDATFVKSLVEDAKYGWDRYEYFADACHALELHSGDLPTNWEAPTEAALRAELENRLQQLKDEYVLATTQVDKNFIANDIRELAKTLECHPIIPTSDILGFFMDPVNTPLVGDKERRLAELTRFEARYSTQVVGRTKVLHEGMSHWVDTMMPHEPELDFIRLGMDRVIDMCRYDTMHDAWPVYYFSDPYALGHLIIEYIDQTYSRQVGTEIVKFNRLKVLDEDDIASGKWQPEEIETSLGKQSWIPRVGDIVETDEECEKEVPKWDRSFLLEVAKTYDDFRLFSTFLTEDFFQKLHKKALNWVNKMFMMINKILKDRGWDPGLVFEGDRFPQTLEEMFEVISIWWGQLEMGDWMVYFGYGAPRFPVSQTALYQMASIIQMIAAYDYDKEGYKRQMLLGTSLFAIPNIKIVDTGRETKAGRWTLRHEYDQDFGPLKQGHARQTLREHYKYSGPVRLITVEILTDSYGRPWGPPRPYEYRCDNGKTVKERWLQG